MMSTCTSCTLITIDHILELHILCNLLAQDVSRHLLRILRVESECRPRMASIQGTPAWTRLIRSCYCSLPTFGPSWLPYGGNFSVFVRRITWPIFAKWGEPRFLLEHACDLSVHDSSRWSLLISWYRTKNWSSADLLKRCLRWLNFKVFMRSLPRVQCWPSVSCSDSGLEAAKFCFGIPCWAC